MAQKSKEELLAASMQELVASQAALDMAKELHADAVRIDAIFQKEWERAKPNLITIQHLKCDRDWLLHRADDYRREATRYLKQSKKLSRRARWRL